MSFSSLLQKVQSRADLTEPEAYESISWMMEGKAAPQEMKDFLLALREKGEALSEVVGAAKAMRSHATAIKTGGVIVVDTCGTGGDGLKTVNISTMAALVAAGAGVKVAKHGNRSITSACGSADLLEALGVAIDAAPAVVERCLAEANFGFLFAPHFHPAMKVVGPIRKELKVPTLFNLLGPLTNPAGVQHQVVGVADKGQLDLYVQALIALGAERFIVVHGADGQDEISTTGATQIIEFNRHRSASDVERYEIVPETFGIRRVSLHAIRGGSPDENATTAGGVLDGKPGPVREAVLLNAAAALYVAGAAADLMAGVSLAVQSLDRGTAKNVLEKVKKMSRA